MNEKLTTILDNYKNGSLPQDEAIKKITNMYTEDLGFANIDHDRPQRQGFAEVVYCEGKTAEQVAQIMFRLSELNDNIIGTRASEEKFLAVKNLVPDIQYDVVARIIYLARKIVVKYPQRKILIISAGTSDMPIAEEAARTAEIMGNTVERIYDVGVAGLHRLLEKLEIIRQARVIIVIAGMEGALASVIGGLVASPVLAVPTSVGYGANFSGLSALLGMLNSCAAGVSVVNIDNGFGAGRMASIINNMEG